VLQCPRTSFVDTLRAVMGEAVVFYLLVFLVLVRAGGSGLRVEG
jgi:hypothetical protein